MLTDAPPASNATRAAGNAAALTISSLVTSSLLLIWQVTLARGLGAASYGLYGTITALMAIGAMIPDLGMGVIFIRDVARRPDQAGAYLGAVVALRAGLAVVGYVVLQAVAVAFGYNRDLRSLLALVAVNLLVDAVGTTGHEMLVAAEHMWWTALVGVAHVLLLVSLGWIALAAGGGLWGVYLAVVAASVARLIAYKIVLGRHGWRPRFPVDREVARRLFASGLPLGAAALLSLGFMHADKLVTTAVVGAEGTGQLMAAFVVVFGVVEVLGTATLVAAFPVMSRSDPAGPAAPAHAVMARLVFFDMLVGVPAGAVLVVCAPAITSVLFGPAYHGAATVLSVMGWYVVVRLIEGVLVQTLTVRDRQTRVLTTRAAGLAINLVLTVMLLPRMGIVGAAIGMLAGQVAIVAAMLIVLSPPAAWWTGLGSQLARLILPTTGLWAGLLVLVPRVHSIVAAVISIVAYGVLAIAGGAVTREHWDLVTHVVWQVPADALSRIRSRR